VAVWIMRKGKQRTQSGVTLIEMLVVVTIIALFAGVVGLRMWKQADKARTTAARAQINTFMGALSAYKMDTGVFPTTEQGLQSLRVAPQDANNWQGPYLERELPNDPWGRPYIYNYPSGQGDEPEIISYGADGQPGGDGANADIVSWKAQ
jgi:general secretion pathway protein G